MNSGAKPLDLVALSRLDFEAVDTQRFPCLRLAIEAMSAGGTASTLLNAANEVAVSEFLAGRIRFTDSARTVDSALENLGVVDATNLETILEADRLAREYSINLIRERAA